MKTHRRNIQRKREKEAKALLADPRFLFWLLTRVRKLGVVGEKRNLIILALACLGRTLPRPASVLVKGPSSSGKSTLVESILQLFSPRFVIERAGLSRKAIAHGLGSLAGKILFINEYRGGKESQYFTRLLQTQGQVTHEFTAINGAKRGTKISKRVGSPVVLSTTTDSKVFEDDETRFLSIPVDFSPKQSRRIVLARARSPRASDRRDLSLWQKATSLVQYEKGDFEDQPRWLEYVAKNLPLSEVRVRRDWDRFLTFCNSVALTRNVARNKPVNISFEDYCVAFHIFEPVFASSLEDLRTGNLYSNTVAQLYQKKKRPISIREIAEELRCKESLVHKQLKISEQKGLIKYDSRSHERNRKFVLPISIGIDRFLPHPRSVLKHYTELGKEVTYVSPFSGKKKTIRR